MVGAGVLKECLDDPRVQSVLAVGRTSCGIVHPKVEEVLHADFFDFAKLQNRFADCDACFFCLGVSSAGMKEADYHRLTYDLTLAAARTAVAANPGMTFCYVSGQATDSTERGRVMWARVKGRTENAILALPFKAAYMFRPGYIQPLKGVKSKTRIYQAIYDIVGPLYPLIRRLAPRSVTTSVNVGLAMIRVAVDGYPRRLIETDDINRLAA
jgi:uncharacterized protein YbjT (DUF2867 family)